jgi:hypothetical protein
MANKETGDRDVCRYLCARIHHSNYFILDQERYSWDRIIAIERPSLLATQQDFADMEGGACSQIDSCAHFNTATRRGGETISENIGSDTGTQMMTDSSPEKSRQTFLFQLEQLKLSPSARTMLETLFDIDPQAAMERIQRIYLRRCENNSVRDKLASLPHRESSRFMEIAIQKGYLTLPKAEELVRRRRLDRSVGLYRNIADTAIQNNFLTSSQVMNITRHQRKWTFADETSMMENQSRVGVWPGALVLLGFVIFLLCGMTVRNSVGVAALVAVSAYLVIGIRRVTSPFHLLLSAVSLGSAVIKVIPLSVVAGRLSSPTAALTINSTINNVAVAIVIAQLVFVIGRLYWTTAAKKLLEARVGILRDLLIAKKNAGDDGDLESFERQVLKALRRVHQLTPWDTFLRDLFPGWYKHLHVCVVKLTREGDSFRIAELIHSEKLPDRAKEAFEWVKQNHRPAVFDAERFDIIDKAVEAKDIKKNSLRNVISLSGYTLATGQTSVSNDLSTCPIFDTSYFERLVNVGFGDEVEWVRFRSAMAFPTGADTVISVLKNRRDGFTHQDIEITHAFAAALADALREGNACVHASRGSGEPDFQHFSEVHLH